MNLNEARAYLSYNESQDIEEFYDDFIFDQKQFFKQKQVHKKLYEAKFKKINQALHAFETLGIEDKTNSSKFSFTTPTFTSNIQTNFHTYHNCRNSLFFELYNATFLSEIEPIATSIIFLENLYTETWISQKHHFSMGDQTNIIDPMNVLADILLLEKKGIINTEEYNPNIHTDCVFLKADIYRLFCVNH
jgi:hypothetical protein